MLSGGPMVEPRHPTLQSALESAARSRWGLSFLDAQERETRMSFAELHERAQKAAGGLRQMGIRPRDRVAIVLPTGPEFMDAFFGAVLAGAVPVPLYPPLRLGRMEEFHRRTARMLQVSGARVVLSDGRISRFLGVAVANARPPPGDLCGLAAAVPRHGAGRVLAAGGLPAGSVDADSARGVPRPPGDLVARDLPQARHHLGGAELRVRALRPARARPGDGRRRSLLLAFRAERRGAGRPRGAAPLLRAIRAQRLRRPSADAGVWAIGSVPGRCLHALRAGSANLVESEFFGHARGAFTGADRLKVGKFAAVGQGTLTSSSCAA